MVKRYWLIALVSVLLLVGFTSTIFTSYFVAYRSMLPPKNWTEG